MDGMQIILLLCLILNFLVFKYDFNEVIALVIIASYIAFNKAFHSEKFSDIYNIHNFKYKISLENISELIATVLITIMVFTKSFKNLEFYIIDPIIFIGCAFLIYRFLLFNASKK